MKASRSCDDIWRPDRIIADTNVYVSLFLNPDGIGAPLKSLITASYNYDLILLTHIIKELKSIPIKHEKIYRKILNNNINLDRMLFLISAFFANNIYDTPKSLQIDGDLVTVLNDPNDVPILKGIVGSGTNLLLTTDNDFLRTLSLVDFRIMSPYNFCGKYVNFPENELEIADIIKEYCDLLLSIRKSGTDSFLDIVKRMEEANELAFNPLPIGRQYNDPYSGSNEKA